MRPEAVVFDLGKVLVDFDYSLAGRRIAERGNIPPRAVQEFIDHSPLLFRYETGRMTRHDFYQAVCAATGFSGSLDEFAHFFADIFTPIDAMVGWQARLRAAGVPTYIFSNTNDLAVEHIRRSFPFFSNFTGYIYSFEEGAMKPDPAIYEALERLSGLQQGQLYYLDDRLENVQAGAGRGWRVMHHRDPDESIEMARRLGLPG